MEEATTVRTFEFEEDPLPKPVQQVMLTGQRHRCALCHEVGEQGTPRRLCHHCGRPFCTECAPQLAPIWRLFFENRELVWRQEAQAQPGFEAAHCPFCVHYTPRWPIWFLLVSIGMFALMGILWILQFSLLFVLLLPLLLAATVGALLLWVAERGRSEEWLFFPLLGNPPLLELRESFEADGVLDEEGYRESVRQEMPQGTLTATVDLEPEMAAQLDALQDVHNLDDAQLELVDAVAGTVVLEGVSKVFAADPPWLEQNARRWELRAPLPRWPLVWTGRGPQQQTLEYHYKVNWRIPRLPFGFAFPIQVQAHFREGGNRQTLELLFVLTGWMPRLKPLLQRALLQRGEGLPAFALHPDRGRPTSGSARDEVVVEDLPLESNQIARLLLQLEEPPPRKGEAWLTGEVQVLFRGNTFSGMKIDGFYDALGVRRSRPRQEMSSKATLRFRINVAALPYQSTILASDELTLGGVSVRRDDAIVEALAEATRLISVHEEMLEQLVLSDGSYLPLATRDLSGHWMTEAEAELSPALYRVHLTPNKSTTTVHVQVEATVRELPEQATRAEAICRQLTRIIRKASNSYSEESVGRTTGTGGRSTGKDSVAGSTLLSKLQKGRDDAGTKE